MMSSRTDNATPTATVSTRSVLVAPMVFGAFVIIFKILKIGRAYLSWFEPAVVVGAVVAAGCGAAVMFAFVLWWLRTAKPPGRIWTKLAVAALGGLLAAEAAVALFTGSFEFMTLRLVGLLAWDLALVSLILAALLFTWRRHPRLALVTSVLLSSLLLLLYSVEAAFFLRTGSQGNWLLARFLIASYDVKGAVAEDVNWWQILWIALPQVILYVILVLVARVGAGDESRRGRLKSPSLFAIAGAALVLIAVIFPTNLLPPSYQAHRESLALSIVRDAVSGIPSADLAQDVEFPLPAYGRSTTAVPMPNSEPKNVIVLVLESTRASSAPPANEDGLWMPFLDSLARQSVVVDRMYTTVPYTTEALLALFGGLMPPFSRVSSYEDVAETGWPELLAANGYATAFFTASYLNEKRGEREMLQRLGFSTVVGAEDIAEDQASVRTYSGVDDFSIMGPALTWMDGVLADSSRFVLACLTQSSHHPYELPPDVESRLTETGDRELGLYLNTLAYVDDFLREFYQALRRRDLLESTVLVVVGDHGESFGEHGARFHGMNVWEEGVRVPFILHDGKGGVSKRISGPFQQTDLLPTVMESAGFELSGAELVARSVLSDPPRSRVYIASAGSQSMALVTDSLKYVYHYRRRPMQVFDLAKDPFEVEDLAGRLSQQALRGVEIDLLLWENAVNGQK